MTFVRLCVVGRYALFIQQKHTSNNENNRNTPKKSKKYLLP